MRFERKQREQQVKLFQGRLPNAKVLPDDQWVMPVPPPPPPPPKDPYPPVGSAWWVRGNMGVRVYTVTEHIPAMDGVHVEWYVDGKKCGCPVGLYDFDPVTGIFVPIEMENE